MSAFDDSTSTKRNVTTSTTYCTSKQGKDTSFRAEKETNDPNQDAQDPTTVENDTNTAVHLEEEQLEQEVANDEMMKVQFPVLSLLEQNQDYDELLK